MSQWTNHEPLVPNPNPYERFYHAGNHVDFHYVNPDHRFFSLHCSIGMDYVDKSDGLTRDEAREHLRAKMIARLRGFADALEADGNQQPACCMSNEELAT